MHILLKKITITIITKNNCTVGCFPFSLVILGVCQLESPLSSCLSLNCKEKQRKEEKKRNMNGLHSKISTSRRHISNFLKVPMNISLSRKLARFVSTISICRDGQSNLYKVPFVQMWLVLGDLREKPASTLLRNIT